MKKLLYAWAVFIGVISLSSCLKEDENTAEGVPNTMAAVQVVRDVYRGADVRLAPGNLGGAYLTRGVVISDAASKNLPAGYVVVQDYWRGLIRGIIFDLGDAASTWAVGDSLSIDLRGGTLTKRNGALVVTNLAAANVTKVSSNNTPAVRTVSIDELNKNFDKYESTLVSVTADVTPLPNNEPFAGSKVLLDAAENKVHVVTENDAVFATEKIAPSATFVGIAFPSEEAPQLRLQSLQGMKFPSGPIYPGYPEDFDFPDAGLKASYNMTAINNNIDLRTGNWKLQQAILGNTVARDRIVSGTQAIRMQQNLTTPAYLQMNYDLPNGAAKVTFWYGSYYNDVSSTFRLEYSTDGGTTWTQIGNDIRDAHMFSENTAAKQAVFMMNISGPVRFRIHKRGLGASSGTSVQNGRLGIDDVAIYQNY